VVEEAVRDTVALIEEFNRINEKLAEPMSDDEMDKTLACQSAIQEKLDALDAWDLDSRLEMAMDALRCPSGETPVKVISGGERRRVALCRLLLQKPDILLLDEPTNHLDAETVAWLEHHLQQYSGTVIAVTHDRYFLDNVAGWILELDRGRGIPWKGNYSSWLEQKRARLKQEKKTESKRQKTLERELEWVRMAPKARHAKSKARITAYEKTIVPGNRQTGEDLEIYIRPARAWAMWWWKPRTSSRASATTCSWKTCPLPAARRHRRRHRSERRRQDHPLSHGDRPGAVGCRHDPHRRYGETGLC